MAERLGEAVLYLTTNATGLTRGLNRARISVGRHAAAMQQRMSSLGTSMSAGLMMPLAIAAREGVAELRSMESANRQTAATIARVGKTTGITSKHVGAYARQLHQLTGMDDQAIQSGENLLLTLGNISNQTGEGRKHFAQASQAMVDMAASMGTEPVAAAKMLGKALANPEKGMTLLGRAGVRLTKQQEDQIKAMSKAGDVAGAQGKLIELVGKKFAGAGKAMGQTTEAKLNRAREAFAGASASLLTTMLPTLEKLMVQVEKAFQWFETLSPSVKRFVAVGLAVAVAMGPVASIIGGIAAGVELLVAVAGALLTPWGALIALLGASVVVWAKSEKGSAQLRMGMRKLMIVGKRVLGWFRSTGWPAFQAASEKAGAWLGEVVVPRMIAVLKDLGKTLQVWARWAQAFWRKHGDEIISALRKTWTVVGPMIKNALGVAANVIRTALAIMRGDWSGAWNRMRAALKLASDNWKLVLAASIRALRTILAAGLNSLRMLAAAGWAKVKAAALDALRALPGAVASLMAATVRALLSALATMVARSAAAAVKIVNALVNGLRALPGRVAAALRALPGVISRIGGQLSRAAAAAAAQVAAGLARGLKSAPGAVWNGIKGIPGTIARLAKDALTAGKSIGTAIGDGLKAGVKAAKSALLATVRGLVKEIKDEFKRKMKIKSPSQVMAREIGMPIGDGIAAGMIASAKRIDRASTMLGKRARKRLSGSLTGAPKPPKDNQPTQFSLLDIWNRGGFGGRKPPPPPPPPPVVDLMAPVEKLQALMEYQRAQWAVTIAKSGGPTAGALEALRKIAENEATQLQAFLTKTKGLTIEQKTELLNRIAELTNQQREYSQQISEIAGGTPDGTMGGIGATPGGNQVSSFSYGDALLGGSRFGGTSRPVVGKMNVTVTDATVDVPRFMRRLDWHSRLVGAY